MTDTHDETTTTTAPASPGKTNGNGIGGPEAAPGPAAEMTKSSETEAVAGTAESAIGNAKGGDESDTTPPASPKAMKKVVTDVPAPTVESVSTAEVDNTPTPTPSSPTTKDKGKGKAVSVVESTPGSLYSSSSLQLSDLPPPASAQTIEVEGGSNVDGVDSSPSRRPRLATVDTEAYSPSTRHAPDSPTTSLIASLRQQLELVSDQAQQLNTKLVASISRHADLEDQVFTLQEEKEKAALHVAELERAKAQWEESMNTGLLVERDQITAEMQRLAAGLVEEERKRGTAEERRAQVENEVDDLAASLFDQANTMVAAERMSRALAEARLKESEENLAAAESAVRDMQLHLQALSATAQSEASTATVARAPLPRRILASHPPYAEFLSFLQHLRAARPRTARSRDLYPAPVITNLLAQPFLARCVVEDHDPTLRLDTAPDLGWVSRRSVGSAIISGDLLIEPVNAASLGPAETISCALCGRHVFGQGQAPQSRFSLNKIFSSPTTASNAPANTSVYVFRMSSPINEPAKSYPLCRNGWCLERLRAACALWHFIRTGIVVPVWNSEDMVHSRQTSVASTTPTVTPVDERQTTTGSVHSATSSSAPSPVPASVRSVSTSATASAASSNTSSPAQPEPRRKSAWGIGGWGSWSRPSTPFDSKKEPETPQTPQEDESPSKPQPLPLSQDTKPYAPSAPSPLAQTKTVGSDSEDDKEAKEVEKTQAEEKTVDKAVDMEEKAEKEDEKKDVKVEDKAEDKVEDKVEELAEKDTLAAPARSESRASHSGSEGSFATPEATPVLAATELPGSVEKVKEEKETDKEAEKEVKEEKDAEEKETEAKVDTPEKPVETPTEKPTTPEPKEDKPEGVKTPEAKSPVALPNGPNGDVPTPSPSPRPPARSANRGLPPPLPKRNAARSAQPSPHTTPTQASVNQEAKTEVKEMKETSPEPATKDATEVKDIPEVKAESLETEAAPATASTSTSTEPETVKDDAEKPSTLAVDNAVSPGAASAPPSLGNPIPPPLPPRHGSAPTSPQARGAASAPRTPVSAPLGSLRAAQDEPQQQVPDKTFATGDSWEVRAWRQVISLKEDMWRTRVGVIDDTEA